MKEAEKHNAIELRRQGLSYSEILTRIPVAKSTLSLWLRSIKLARRQKQRLTAKRKAASIRGGEVRKQTRIQNTQRIIKEAEADIDTISKRDLWLIGTVLYWAEGTKEKEDRPGAGIQFANSDWRMILLFLQWLFSIYHVDKKELVFELYIHKNSQNQLDDVIRFWSIKLRLPIQKSLRVYFKRNKPKTNRKNVGNSYVGVLKVKVRASSVLNRKIVGWIQGICRQQKII